MTIDRLRRLYVENLRDALDLQLRLAQSILRAILATSDDKLRRSFTVRLSEARQTAAQLRILIDDLAPGTRPPVNPSGGSQTVYLFLRQDATL